MVPQGEKKSNKMSSSTRVCDSSYNVFSWKISMEDWTEVIEGESLPLQFETVVPPKGVNVTWNLKIFPKGTSEVEKKDIKVGIEIEDYEDELDTDDDKAQFQIETAYRIRHSSITKSSISTIHSSMFKQHPHQWLNSYEDCTVEAVEGMAVNGFLTFEFEIRTYSASKWRFQLSTHKESFVNNFEEFQKYGDVKIFCGAKEFRCHKLLLTSQSPVFKAMFDQENSKESIYNAVDIQDCTPEAVEDFLFFLYNAMLRPFRFSSVNLELLFGLVHLSSKYQVELLMPSCMDFLMDIMAVDNVLKIFVVVDRYKLGSHISNMVREFMKKNIAVLVDKEEWGDFVADPSFVKDFILDINKELADTKEALKKAESCKYDFHGKNIKCAMCNESDVSESE